MQYLLSSWIRTFCVSRTRFIFFHPWNALLLSRNYLFTVSHLCARMCAFWGFWALNLLWKMLQSLVLMRWKLMFSGLFARSGAEIFACILNINVIDTIISITIITSIHIISWNYYSNAGNCFTTKRRAWRWYASVSDEESLAALSSLVPVPSFWSQWEWCDVT